MRETSEQIAAPILALRFIQMFHRFPEKGKVGDGGEMSGLRAVYRNLSERFGRHINDLSLRKKLRYLYYFCILVPIMLTDAVILISLIRTEQSEQRREMADVAGSVEYNMANAAETASVIARTLFLDRTIRDFLRTEFQGPQDYYTQFRRLMDESVLKGITSIDNSVITIYADNEGIVNGGGFVKVSDVRDEKWFKLYSESGEGKRLIVYDDGNGRHVSFLRTLNPATLSDRTEMFVKIDLYYSSLALNITSMNYEYPVYICIGDWTVISSEGPNNLADGFNEFTQSRGVGLEEDFELYGQTLTIRVLYQSNNVLAALKDNAFLILLLLLFNIISPRFILDMMERSFNSRIFRLGDVFNQVDSEELIMIPGDNGKDEIGGLMDNYNRMAKRMNDLIDQVYRNRLKEQEMDIARQNAELLALQSQINPHFLFNALESIRMHSILKDERETADMVEKLAIMERQNVDWSNDTNTVKKELEFVEAYLALQKYRFGERLSYRVEVQPGCEDIRVPKLTITTFVENACVHGIESKTSPGWIFVRVNTENDALCVEVEDTGGGMEEEEVHALEERMRNASIDMLKGKGRVGVVNACLRIRMMTDGGAGFSVESEKGVGTVFTIRIPLVKTERTV